MYYFIKKIKLIDVFFLINKFLLQSGNIIDLDLEV